MDSTSNSQAFLYSRDITTLSSSFSQKVLLRVVNFDRVLSACSFNVRNCTSLFRINDIINRLAVKETRYLL